MRRIRSMTFNFSIVALTLAVAIGVGTASAVVEDSEIENYVPGAGGSIPGDSSTNGRGGDGNDGDSSSSRDTGRNLGQPGSSQAGQPGVSGNQPPPAPPPAPSTTTPRRTTSSSGSGTGSPSTSGSGSATGFGADIDGLLLEDMPEASPSPSPTASPTSSPPDFASVLDDADPADADGSLVPFLVLLTGSILLLVYLRKRSSRRRGSHSRHNRRRGSHTLR